MYVSYICVKKENKEKVVRCDRRGLLDSDNIEERERERELIWNCKLQIYNYSDAELRTHLLHTASQLDSVNNRISNLFCTTEIITHNRNLGKISLTLDSIRCALCQMLVVQVQ